jgi:multiple sugar transport system permease protein
VSAAIFLQRAQGGSLRRWLEKENRGWLLVGYLILALAVVWTILPLYWVTISSLKPDADFYKTQDVLWPSHFTFQHYRDMLFASGFPGNLRNSLVVALGTTLVSTVIGSMAGYALVRLRFPGRQVFGRLLIYCYLAPGSILFIPIFAMMVHLNLTNSLFGLGLTYLTFTVPFATWMMMGYMSTVPVELEEAALVDGASRWTSLWRIVLPLTIPALVVVSVFSFTLSWNEFLYALVLVQKQEVMTAPVGLAFLQAGDVFYWGKIMAAALIMSIPPLVLYLIGQKWLVSGWTLGSVKG